MGGSAGFLGSVCLLGYFGSFGSGFFCSFEFSPFAWWWWWFRDQVSRYFVGVRVSIYSLPETVDKKKKSDAQREIFVLSFPIYPARESRPSFEREPEGRRPLYKISLPWVFASPDAPLPGVAGPSTVIIYYPCYP